MAISIAENSDLNAVDSNAEPIFPAAATDVPDAAAIFASADCMSIPTFNAAPATTTADAATPASATPPR